MRALLILIGLALLVLIVLLSLGFISIDQTQPARLPEFEANVGSVDVGTRNETVQVPTVDVQKPGEAPER